MKKATLIMVMFLAAACTKIAPTPQQVIDLGAALNRKSSEKDLMTSMQYHKVPQAAAAVGATAWLVSKMADSKGQMSNSQLYGQQQSY